MLFRSLMAVMSSILSGIIMRSEYTMYAGIGMVAQAIVLGHEAYAERPKTKRKAKPKAKRK